MKLIGTILLANAVEAKIVRTPGIRAQRNQRFLATVKQKHTYIKKCKNSKISENLY
jgi:hypothetical protein